MTRPVYHPTQLPRQRPDVRQSARPIAVRPPQKDPVMTVPEIATEMRVSRMSVYRAIHAKELKASRLGRLLRVRRSEFERWAYGTETVLEADK